MKRNKIVAVLAAMVILMQSCSKKDALATPTPKIHIRPIINTKEDDDRPIIIHGIDSTGNPNDSIPVEP